MEACVWIAWCVVWSVIAGVLVWWIGARGPPGVTGKFVVIRPGWTVGLIRLRMGA